MVDDLGHRWSTILGRPATDDRFPLVCSRCLCRDDSAWANQECDAAYEKNPHGVTHACPPEGSGIMPCCGRTPLEVPRADLLTLRRELVTCKVR